MAGGEELSPLLQPINVRGEGPCVLNERSFGRPFWDCSSGDSFLLRKRREIYAAVLALCDNGHQPRSHASSLALGFNVVTLDGCVRHQATKIGTARELGTVLCSLCILWLAHFHHKAVATIFNHWLDVCLFPWFRRKHEC